MDNTVDLLQIKIEQAKAKLPIETLNAIAAVDWQAVILGMREKKGYSFEQLGDLEVETELLLCGLLSPENYSKELEKRMKISKAQANELVNEMNDLVFKRIKEELIKNTERKKIFRKSEKSDIQVLKSAGIEIITKPDLTLPELKAGEKTEVPARIATQSVAGGHPILAQKLSSSFQVPSTKTEHTLNNISKTIPPSSYPPKADPYRLSPDE